ncbi:MAG: phosphate ABC transporter permease PstA [Hyphomicrobium sp.]
MRYRAERRFKFYGIVALAITTSFLLFLGINIVKTGLPGFFHHTLLADVYLDEKIIAPKGNKDVATLRAADYQALARAALAQIIPGIEGRQLKKELNGLLSSGAGDNLREAVLSQPNLIGQTIKGELLLSDNVEQYLKGNGTSIQVENTLPGAAVASSVSGDVTITLSENGFSSELQKISKEKHLLSGLASQLKTPQEETSKELQNEDLKTQGGLSEDLSKQTQDTGTSIALDTKIPSRLIEINGGIVKLNSLSEKVAVGQTIIPLSSTAEAPPGSWKLITYQTPEADRNINDPSVTFLEKIKSKGHIEENFNWYFLTSGDSREPELAGIRGALMGSVLTLLVTLFLCLPVGVLAAVYLEEFAPKNRITHLIEININNLAAVPSIVFGLLGLAVFINFFGLPRSAPLVGGLVLALLVLPTIIIASRAAIKSVPPSIREAALGVGASHQQAVFHHVLPLALPGIMTGTIIGMAHALGETAPLLMIGMVAFIVDVPASFTEAATALPVQIFLWSDLPEPAFKEKTGAAIIVLLLLLSLMNSAAILLRRKFERRW